jgi:hypothetical protein
MPTQTELEKMIGYTRPKRHKYGAVRVTCRLGHRHPSKAEAMHCWALQCELNQGSIKDLEYEKSYDLLLNGKKIGVHRPDFTFKRPIFIKTPTGPRSETRQISWEDPQICVDEVKGFKTADWIMKSKMFKALYPQIQYRVIE